MLPLHTVTFEAANGFQETYHCDTWDQFHIACQTMEKRGFRLVRWLDRSGRLPRLT